MDDVGELFSWPKVTAAPPAPSVERCATPDDLEIVAEGLGFPEGPIACRDGSVLVVDVREGGLIRIPESGAIEVVAQLGAPNGAAAGPDGAVYVCNNGGLPWTQREDGSWYPMDPETGSMTPAGFSGGWVDRVELRTGQVSRIVGGFAGRPLSAPSDMAFDRDGFLYFTDIGKTGVESTALGSVYRSRPDGSDVGLLASGLPGPNGITLSLDGTQLYVADTPSGRILSFDISTAQLPVNSRVHGAGVRGRLPGLASVDGLAVDAEGRVIVALPQSSALGVVQPDGGVWLIEMPDPLPTNVCFGGNDGRTMFVTLGGHGRLVRFRWPCPGAPVAFSV